ncbi:unnamed protein product, partial [Prorocentrum cordatum]
GWASSKSTVLSYFTAKDWEIMGNPDTAFNDQAKIMCAVSRLVRGGMLKPSPPVCADVIAALAAATWTGSVDEVLLYNEVHNLSQTFASWETDPSANDLPIVRKWPDSPHDLPPEVARAMYPDPADQPVVVAIQMFTKVRKVTSCRNTKAVIRDKVKPKSQSSALVVAHPQPVQPSAGVNSTSFAANIGALLESAQTIGLNPTQIAQMGAQLFMQAALQNLDLLGSKAKTADDDAKKMVESMEAEHQALFAKAKEAAATEKAIGAAAEAAAVATGKRGKTRKVITCNSTVVMKRPAAKMSAAGAAARPSMPDTGSVLHLGGRILIAPTRKAWRVWPNKDRVTIERQVAFGTCMETSFGLACGLTDAYWK